MSQKKDQKYLINNSCKNREGIKNQSINTKNTNNIYKKINIMVLKDNRIIPKDIKELDNQKWPVETIIEIRTKVVDKMIKEEEVIEEVIEVDIEEATEEGIEVEIEVIEEEIIETTIE